MTSISDHECDLGQASSSAWSPPSQAFQYATPTTTTPHSPSHQRPPSPDHCSTPSPLRASSSSAMFSVSSSKPRISISSLKNNTSYAPSHLLLSKPPSLVTTTTTPSHLTLSRPSNLHAHSHHHPPTPNLKQTMPIPKTSLNPHLHASVRRWIYTFALINFDLDEGPDFDNCYPPAHLTAPQLTNIAFSSFPDCTKTGSLTFSWRIPAFNHSNLQPPLSASLENPPITLALPSSCTSPLPTTPSTPAANFDLHGYVYFVQERDPSVLRGYNQKSLVLITHLADHAGLFSTLISRLAPLYTSQGPGPLEAAILNISQWPDPTPGTTLELPFLGQIHTFVIPLSNQAQLIEPRSQTKSTLNPEASPLITIYSIHSSLNSTNQDHPILGQQILASRPLTYLSSILFGGEGHMSLSSIWLIWEILILGEPLVVYGSSPDLVSEAVIHLRNLIRPIPFQGDWRPYITIHDPDFPNLFNKSKPRTGALIGATNPIILSNTQYWPHVLSLSSKQGTFGLTTERKRHLHKDKQLVKQLEACLDHKDYHHADVLLSRHFALLTEQFLQPLHRYFTTLLPQDKSLCQPQRPNSFNQGVFLKSLKAHATLLEFRFKISSGLSNSIASFYTKFLRSPNFASWLHSQIDAAATAVRARYLDRLQSPLELDSWTVGKTRTEINELLKRIEDEMSLVVTSARPKSPPSSSMPYQSSYSTTPISPLPGSPSELTERLRAQADRLRSISNST